MQNIVITTRPRPVAPWYAWGPELSLALAGAALFILLPEELGFATSLVIGALFALSLDLVLGYAGIVSLGHAAMFGTGAYAAGLFAVHVSGDPLLGLAFGASCGAIIAWISGLLVLRVQGLTSVMITLTLAQLLYEAASKWRALTGGDDGFSGIEMQSIFGLFDFDYLGRTGFIYALTVLIIVYACLRRLVGSPFGLSLVGLREDRMRMVTMGCDANKQLTRVYIIGGAIAGIAGALSAQITQVVGLSSLSFTHSAEVVIMVVLGGTGRLWGAMLGAAVFIGVHHIASTIDPLRWMLFIGILLLVVVMAVPGGLSSAVVNLYARFTKVKP